MSNTNKDGGEEKKPLGAGVVKVGSFYLRAAMAAMERERMKEKFKKIDEDDKKEQKKDE